MRECGRSMVEMLGVLAIIGVLSVGAIAGYSKAMMKYKLNKQAEQLSTLVNAGLYYAGQWNLSESASLIPYLIKLNEVPKEMIKSQNQVTIYDVFNTAIQMTYIIYNGLHYTQFVIQLDTSSNSNQSLDICRNVVNVAKPLSVTAAMKRGTVMKIRGTRPLILVMLTAPAAIIALRT